MFRRCLSLPDLSVRDGPQRRRVRRPPPRRPVARQTADGR